MNRQPRRTQPPPRSPQRRPRGLVEQINYAINRLPIPTLGRFTTLIGIGGAFLVTLVIGVVCALIVRDIVNPPGPGDNISFLPPNSTPNPEFLAPTIDIGNAYQWQGN